jgi:hypothetical protein
VDLAAGLTRKGSASAPLARFDSVDALRLAFVFRSRPVVAIWRGARTCARRATCSRLRSRSDRGPRWTWRVRHRRSRRLGGLSYAVSVHDVRPGRAAR